jgi:hypothetical protein
VIVGEPEAATVKVATAPAVTVWLVGCVVIVGAVASPAPFAGLPVLLPLGFVTVPEQPARQRTANADSVKNACADNVRRRIGNAVLRFPADVGITCADARRLA